MSEIVRIPSERMGVLIPAKKNIEEKCKVSLDILREEYEIIIGGDPADVFFARDIVKAIGRGFTANEAFYLLKQDYNLIIISLKDIIGSEKSITRLKGRVIGEKGKIKIMIEDATGATLSIYGNTISIIAQIDSMHYAKEAVEMLLDGAPHNTVINYLAKARREITEGRLLS